MQEWKLSAQNPIPVKHTGNPLTTEISRHFEQPIQLMYIVKIGGGSGVINDIADNHQVMGYPAIALKEFVKQRKK